MTLSSEWVSEWVSDYCLTPSNVSVISWRKQVTFWLDGDDDDDDDICFVVEQLAAGDSSLKQQSVGKHVAPLKHIILIPSQQVFTIYLLQV